MWTVIDSPIGELRLVAARTAEHPDGALTAIEFSPFRKPAHTDDAAHIDLGEHDDTAAVLVAAARQLGEYFAGERRDFDLPLAPHGTAFQQEVWAELLRIGWGQTASYGEVARRLGRTNAASRAVGLANGRNPIPVVIPCHRVIGSNGSLTGYAGGMARKQVLLDLEADRADVLF
nr:methylated-DNA--[protein]-cysteine S-methyltransferase [Nocardioides sp.]